MTEPLDLKKTVNLPKTNFAQKANLAQSEPARLQKWNEAKLYEQIRESKKGAEKYILHDGPPYANADIHIGTALNKILKDLSSNPDDDGFRRAVCPRLRLSRLAD
jgi:isoleucyl-tRNA synthetase